jgi:hypothetical protein
MSKFILGIVSLIFFSCDGFFGTKTDSSFLGTPDFQVRPVSYVPIEPGIQGLVTPTDVLAGLDQLIYVVDSGTSELIAYDYGMVEVGRRKIQGAKKVAQNRKLEMAVLGQVTLNIDNIQYDLDAIYILNLSPKGSGSYGLNLPDSIQFLDTLIYPFDFEKTVSLSKGKDLLEQVRINDIAFMSNGEFYVTRSGPINALSQQIIPDDAVLIFSSKYKFKSGINISTVEFGIQRDYFKFPFSLTTNAQPPQIIELTQSYNFYFTSLDPNTALGVQSIRFISTDNEIAYVVEEFPVGDTTKADGFLYTPFRFKEPRGLTFAGDETNYIWVTDVGTDSVYLFSNTGLEGAQPPPGSTSKKNINVSFGGPGVFGRPESIAYVNKIIYIADSERGRVIRFMLTTDFD